ncbi:PREDICTED: F-box/kelch-repeat protein At4g39560-like [Camelina sativa]|uniref:F-box/kelch-repeat protein At4g39560-like n=1 Tax=Camelina sativa TaxID=90675 RepID=A0ABM0T124_CAMSA|nr:PREDICTED: F-box/kelch-repeat protein At4g39560-like [Camelina sativa]
MSTSVVDEPSANEETSPLLFAFTSLPDPLTLSCLARVSRFDHLALSLVSKRYRSLVISPELYKTRSLLGRTDECHYVCLSTKTYPTSRWFILRRENTKTYLENAAAEDLVPVLSFPTQLPELSSFVALDWGIYVIGGLTNDNRTSDVLLLDCRTNTWRHAPSMGVARASAAAGVVGGKIYVFGGCESLDCSNWAEVFDPKTQTWDVLVPMPDRNEGDNLIRETLVMDEKVYAVSLWDGSFYYSPREGKWGRKKKPETQSYYCVIENVLYSCDKFGSLVWRDSEELEWKEVKGLKALRLKFPSSASFRSIANEKCVSKLSSFGVNIVVSSVRATFDVWWDVWCTEISLERREEEGEIWGTIESEAVTVVDHVPSGRVPVEVLCSATVYV